MKELTQADLQNPAISGGSILLGAIAGGLVNSVIWGGWTAFVDNKPEKVTPKKCALTFGLGALASLTGIYIA